MPVRRPRVRLFRTTVGRELLLLLRVEDVYMSAKKNITARTTQ